jgi:NitT/TauT family transport system permease protein
MRGWQSALIGIAGLLAVWWLTSLGVGGVIVPPPPRVALRFVELLPTVLWRHALASLARMAAALALAFLTAVPLGLLLGRVAAADRLLTPLAYLLYPVPKIALLPVVMLLFGLTDAARVVVVLLVLFFQVLVAVRDGARSIPGPYMLSLRSLGGRGRDGLRYVIWPYLLPSLLTSLRIGTGTALAVLFFAETFATRWGLGYFTVESWMRVSYVDMFAGIAGLGLLGFAVFRGIDLLQRRLCGWQSPGLTSPSGSTRGP